MHTFVLLASISGSPIDPGVISRVNQPDLTQVPFEPDDHLGWSNKPGSVFYSGWQAFAEVTEIGSHWHTDPESLTAFSGHVWPRVGGWDWGKSSWASQLAEFLDARDPRAVHDDLFGIYTALHLPADDIGYVISDLLTTGPIYLAERGDLLAISDRAGLAATAIAEPGQEPQRDILGSCWIPCSGQSSNQDTGYTDVKLIRPWSYVELHPSQGARVVERSGFHSDWPGGEEPASTLEELTPLLEQSIRESIDTIASAPSEHRIVRLTGGLDSRLVTGIILAEGVKDQFEFKTFGLRNHPDVIAASLIADEFGLDWSFQDRSVSDPSETRRQLFVQSYQTEGMRSCWDMIASTNVSRNITISGSFSELFRLGVRSSGTMTSTSREQALDRIAGPDRFNRSGIVRPEIVPYYQQAGLDRASSLLDNGLPYHRLGLMSFAQQSVRGWLSHTTMLKPQIWAYPLYTPTAARVCHYLPADVAKRSQFHFDIMRNCSIPLTKMPTASSGWNEDQYQHVQDADDYRQIEKIRGSGQESQHFRLAAYKAGNKQIFEEVLLDPSNPIYEVLDISKVEEFFQRAKTSYLRLRALYGLLTPAMWLGRYDLPQKISRTTKYEADPPSPRMSSTDLAHTVFSKADADDTTKSTSDEIAQNVPEVAPPKTAIVLDSFRSWHHPWVMRLVRHLIDTDENFILLTSGRAVTREGSNWGMTELPVSADWLLQLSGNLESDLRTHQVAMAHIGIAGSTQDHIAAATAARSTVLISLLDETDMNAFDSLSATDLAQLERPNVHVRGSIADTRVTNSLATRSVAPVAQGIDTDYFTPAARIFDDIETGTRRPIRLVTTGRLERCNGQAIALQALSRLIRVGIAAELKIVGTGSDGEMLQQAADSLGVDCYVELIESNARSKRRRALQWADIALFPAICSSDRSTSVAEAMAMMVPCLLSTIQSDEEIAPEPLAPRVASWDVEGFVTHISRLAVDGSARLQLGEEGRSYVVETCSRQAEFEEVGHLYSTAASPGNQAMALFNAVTNCEVPAEPDILTSIKLEERFTTAQEISR